MNWQILDPKRVHSDERRTGFYDVFPDTVREVNVTQVNPMQSAGDWHRHQHQTDYWVVMGGYLRVGLLTDEQLTNCQDPTILKLQPGDILEIPRGIWHTYFETDCSPVLIYGFTNRYDGTDEERMPYRDTDY
tara:strand:- start:62 stop:457 length:396 start_codon:yes stop_codon:yes gene_type:complete